MSERSFSLAAEKVAGKNIGPNTMRMYQSKLNTIKSFLLSKSSLQKYVVDGEIVVPLPLEAIKEIFGWLSTNTNLASK